MSQGVGTLYIVSRDSCGAEDGLVYLPSLSGGHLLIIEYIPMKTGWPVVSPVLCRYYEQQTKLLDIQNHIQREERDGGGERGREGERKRGRETEQYAMFSSPGTSEYSLF